MAVTCPEAEGLEMVGYGFKELDDPLLEQPFGSTSTYIMPLRYLSSDSLWEEGELKEGYEYI